MGGEEKQHLGEEIHSKLPSPFYPISKLSITGLVLLPLRCFTHPHRRICNWWASIDRSTYGIPKLLPWHVKSAKVQLIIDFELETFCNILIKKPHFFCIAIDTDIWIGDRTSQHSRPLSSALINSLPVWPKRDFKDRLHSSWSDHQHTSVINFYQRLCVWGWNTFAYRVTWNANWTIRS